MTEASPAPARGRLASLGAHVDRLGGMLARPRATIRRFLVEPGGRAGDILLWLILLTAAAVPVRTGKALLLARMSLWDGFLTFVSGLQSRLVPPVIGVLLTAALLTLVGRRRGLGFDRALDVAAHLLVPVLLLTAVGLLLRGFGAEVWFLPHRLPPRTPTLRLVYLLVSYGWSIALLAVASHELTRPPTGGAGPGEVSGADIEADED